MTTRLPRRDPQPLEQRSGRVAVWRHAEPELDLADPVALVEIEPAGEVPHLVTEVSHLSLQGDAGGARELRIVLLPCSTKWRAPVDPVGEMSDRERVDVGVVVELEDGEVLGDQKRRPAGAAQEQQHAVALARKGAAIGASHAEPLPLRK